MKPLRSLCETGRILAEFSIRELHGADAVAFFDLRLEGLEQEPSAFGEAAEEFRATAIEEVARRLDDHRSGNFVLGAAVGARVVGIAGFSRTSRIRRRHEGSLWGVFVASNWRACGVGRALLQALIDRAREQPGMTQITLTVSSENESAKRLYASLGFRTTGLQPRAIKVGEIYYDQDFMMLDLR